jgi:hypothetical protein
VFFLNINDNKGDLNMKLIYTANGNEVKVGEIVCFKNGTIARVNSIEKPRHSGSNGRVYVEALDDPFHSQGYFPSVFNMEWVEREDQPKPKQFWEVKWEHNGHKHWALVGDEIGAKHVVAGLSARFGGVTLEASEQPKR